MRTIVVVGASIAGVTAASTLRAEGYAGRVVVLSEEIEQPYSRVPLSKGVLAGTQSPESATLPSLPDDVELRLGARAVGLRPEQHLVDLADGGTVGYDGLVIACRAAPHVVAAGDVTVQEDAAGTLRRTPHWTNAVTQASAAARALLDPSAPACRHDPYFWTEQFGLDLKIAGMLPARGAPQVVSGDPGGPGGLVQWFREDVPVTAAAVNHRLAVARLKSMARAA